LEDGSRLPEPIYTPSTKAPIGEHDENITRDDVAASVGDRLAGELERLTLALFTRASEVAERRGIILADTKFEFGRDPDGVLRLADEVLTPDSSRFWPADTWQPGRAQPSFDKQYVRDWLLDTDWDRSEPGPALPAEVVAATRARYVEAYERLTGRSFADYLREV
jgi:phosphoribosylaminoimidazole-succinocarboxamide synthase